jgi:hypothetical protein
MINYTNGVRGITIDYVPLQRWVHISVVINETAMVGGTISAYVDGVLVNTVDNTKDLSGLTFGGTPIKNVPAANGGTGTTPQFNITDVNLDMPGYVYTGGASGGGALGMPGFSGMLSMIKFFNYDMNANDVYSEYQKGPIDNLLAKMGLPAYRLQSPLVRVG